MLARAKLNSLEEQFTKAIRDGKITDEEFSDIEHEIKNYENMKSSILNSTNKEKNLSNELKKQLIDKGRTLDR